MIKLSLGLAVVSDVLIHFVTVVVDVVIKLRSGRSDVRIPAEATGYYAIQNVQPACRALPSCSVMRTGILAWS